jgi:hypothetical protein
LPGDCLCRAEVFTGLRHHSPRVRHVAGLFGPKASKSGRPALSKKKLSAARMLVKAGMSVPMREPLA